MRGQVVGVNISDCNSFEIEGAELQVPLVADGFVFTEANNVDVGVNDSVHKLL